MSMLTLQTAEIGQCRYCPPPPSNAACRSAVRLGGSQSRARPESAQYISDVLRLSVRGIDSQPLAAIYHAETPVALGPRCLLDVQEATAPVPGLHSVRESSRLRGLQNVAPT